LLAKLPTKVLAISSGADFTKTEGVKKKEDREDHHC